MDKQPPSFRGWSTVEEELLGDHLQIGEFRVTPYLLLLSETLGKQNLLREWELLGVGVAQDSSEKSV